MENQTTLPTTTYLSEYTAPHYFIDSVDLQFHLGEAFTEVISELQIRRNHETSSSTPLVLNGEALELISIFLDGKEMRSGEYTLHSDKLLIPKLPEAFSLKIITRIKPQENTTLSGLYRSNAIFCTQCEAEGFRRITYFIDRPDVLSRYKTTIIADKTRYPVLLSNGNLIKNQARAENKHAVTWEDPFKKPCYLFALVAGDLDCLEDHFTTRSGRKVTLKIFTDKGQKEKVHHAMSCIKKAMRWDEEAYGREYDLDIFMVVAINDFNMGAMENKGLNIFNAKYILADPQTATDTDYENILSVVGHEYFHNWSGNRITCRDWFQLSLKEGLTIFREQEFMAAMTSPLVSRINEVRILVNSQFVEDSGPFAHPVQPDSYMEINNFYTATIYNKGAEVIRMMKTLIGEKHFRQAMDDYFSRYDGQAVTIEEFVSSMEKASGRDLKQFRLWYKQAGTPELNVDTHYDEAAKKFSLKVKQFCKPTPGQPEKKPFDFPLVMGLLNSQGQDLPLQLSNSDKIDKKNCMLEIKKESEQFEFVHVPEKPVASYLRYFSAPVKLNVELSNKELGFLLKHDSDGFNRWEAGQKLLTRLLLNQMDASEIQMPIDIFQHLIHEVNDKIFLSDLFILPSETYLGEQMSVIDIDGIHRAREAGRHTLAKDIFSEFLSEYQNNIESTDYIFDDKAVGKRRWKNICLNYLLLTNKDEMIKTAMNQFCEANNMTDVMGAFTALINVDCPERDEAINIFYQRWQKDPLVMDKWFSAQAACVLPNTLQHVKSLLTHPAFDIKNPNKVRSLIGTFCYSNLVQFHALNGEGYQFLADQVLILDKLNPQVTARLVEPLTRWRRQIPQRQQLMREQLQRIKAAKGLSVDVGEIVIKSLE
jgi:aminopeptidase N